MNGWKSYVGISSSSERFRFSVFSLNVEYLGDFQLNITSEIKIRSLNQLPERAIALSSRFAAE